MKHIIEWCPTCNTSVSQIPIIDEPNEDCNFFDALKDYKVNQLGSNPYKCACGTKLKPVES